MVSVTSTPGLPASSVVARSRFGLPVASRSATTIRGAPASASCQRPSTPYWPTPSRFANPSTWAAIVVFGAPPSRG